MTILQKEICERSGAIERMGYLMWAGALDITAENEKYLQEAMTLMMVANEDDRKMQEETFCKMPWLRRLAEKN